MNPLTACYQSGVCDCPQKSSGSAQGQLSLISLQEEFNEAGRPNRPAASGPVMTAAAVRVASHLNLLLFLCVCAEAARSLFVSVLL